MCHSPHSRLIYRRPIRRRLIVALAAVTLLPACAGIEPAPRYAPAGRRGQAGVVRELEDRRHAYRSGDEKRLARVVDGYLGIPYLWGGTTRAGMDCSAMARAIFREAYGLELPRTSRQMYRLGTAVPRGKELRPGDLVFFRIADSGSGISHVGVYLGAGQFAHASASRGGVVDALQDPYYQGRYAGGRRVLP